MKYTCNKCQKELELEDYGGYAVTEGKDLCPDCWKEYIEIKNRHHQELSEWWHKRSK